MPDIPKTFIPEDYLALIGGIVTEFNLLDQILTLLLVEITGNDMLTMRDHVPFANMNFGVKKILLDLLIKTSDIQSGSPEENYYSDIRIELDGVAEDRNAVTHSVWTTTDQGKVIRKRFRAKRKIEMEEVEVSLQSLKDQLSRIESCRSKLASIAFRLKFSKAAPHAGQKVKGSLSSALGKALASDK